jgi:hypothetical protein
MGFLTTDSLRSSSTGTRAVWRSITELTLIVVGVLLAFGLEAWWSGQSEARAMNESLLAITVEFETADSVIGWLEDRHRRNIEQFTALSRLLGTGRFDSSADSVLRLSGPLWYQQNFAPTMPAYAEFLAGGGLTNLDQENLVDALFRFEQQLERNRVYDNYVETSMMISWEPILSSRIPFGDLADSTEALRLMTNPQLLAADLEFRNLVELRLYGERTLLARRESLRAAVRGILAILRPS